MQVEKLKRSKSGPADGPALYERAQVHHQVDHHKAEWWSKTCFIVLFLLFDKTKILLQKNLRIQKKDLRKDMQKQKQEMNYIK